MVSVGSRDMGAPRGDVRERQRPLQSRHAGRFKAMLDQAAAMMNPPAEPPVQPPVTVPGTDDQASHAKLSARPRLAEAPLPMPASLVPGSTQSLVLRATTGPLAGLIVQASWRDNRLHLHVQTPKDELRRRIAQHAPALETALGNALGARVSLALEPAHV